MRALRWYSGPPPHVGWWNASVCRHRRSWRWWDGNAWSFSADDSFTCRQAADCARIRCRTDLEIRWTRYWPKNARVKRVRP